MNLTNLNSFMMNYLNFKDMFDIKTVNDFIST